MMKTSKISKSCDSVHNFTGEKKIILGSHKKSNMKPWYETAGKKKACRKVSL